MLDVAAWTVKHGFFVLMGGFHFFDGGMPLHPLSRDDVEELVKRRLLKPPPEEEIQDKSKADGLSKAIALFQTTWFVTECIARRIQGLLITELELITLAYTVITVAMYIAWWNNLKPLNIEFPVRVPYSHSSYSRVISESPPAPTLPIGIPHNHPSMMPPPSGNVILEEHSVPVDTSLRNNPVGVTIRTIFGTSENLVDLRKECGVPIFYSGNPAEGISRSTNVAALIVTVIFGGIHCMAWSSSFNFPSPKAQLLWRISSVIIVTVPVPMLVVIAIVSLVTKVKLRRYIYTMMILRSVTAFVVMIILGVIAYIVARVILLVIGFMQLSAVPCEGFQSVQWISFIPHI
jgi:hypothetical protein